MPNRNSFDPGDRYDHSAHSTRHVQKGDLTVPNAEEKPVTPGTKSERSDNKKSKKKAVAADSVQRKDP